MLTLSLEYPKVSSRFAGYPGGIVAPLRGIVANFWEESRNYPGRGIVASGWPSDSYSVPSSYVGPRTWASTEFLRRKSARGPDTDLRSLKKPSMSPRVTSKMYLLWWVDFRPCSNQHQSNLFLGAIPQTHEPLALEHKRPNICIADSVVADN